MKAGVSGMRILVAEDEKAVAAFLKQGLKEAGYAVDLARDGQEALDHLETVSYDLVVLDIMLPRLDGIGVLRQARARRLKTPVLLLTARDEVGDKVKGLDAGADDYLTKPFAFPELLARIRALLRRPPPQTGTELRLEDLEMDLTRRTVKRGGESLELSPREFALLELFLRHPGQVLTRTQISEHVWENSFSTGTNVVDVYVGYLRRKLDAGRVALLQTVRGVGYRLGGSR
jgi:DNA-binding response OmpR family regulator